MMHPLLELAARCEKARPEDQEALLIAAFVAIYGPKPDRFASAPAVYNEWIGRRARLDAVLAAQAYESAARMLLGDHVVEWEVHHSNTVRYRGSTAHVWSHRRDHIIGKAVEPGLAIGAAALRAHACQSERSLACSRS